MRTYRYITPFGSSYLIFATNDEGARMQAKNITNLIGLIDDQGNTLINNSALQDNLVV